MHIPNMLLVGATARNTGKTTFCAEFIRKWREAYDIIGIKITTIHTYDSHCHHGDGGCGACSSFDGGYEITEERDSSCGKDTCSLLQAGALKVFWVRAKVLMLADAAASIMSRIPRDTVVVCESNSLSGYVTPGVIVVTHRGDVAEIKPSAKPMIEKAGFTVDVSDPESLSAALGGIGVVSSHGGILLTIVDR